METYISILRGINVGGHRKIKMDDMKNMYQELKFQNTKSYVQSGNLVFQSRSKDYRKLEQKITKQIKATFGHDVPVMVRQYTELKDVFENNPFLELGGELKFHHVTFLSEIPSKELLSQLEALDFTPELFKVYGRAIYLHVPGGYHKAKLSNSFFEKKLQVSATTRNWKTVTKLVEMAEG